MSTLCDCSFAKPRVCASSPRSCPVSADLRAPVCSGFKLTSTQRYARRPVTLRIVHQSRRKCSMNVRAAQQSTGEVSALTQARTAALAFFISALLVGVDCSSTRLDKDQGAVCLQRYSDVPSYSTRIVSRFPDPATHFISTR